MCFRLFRKTKDIKIKNTKDTRKKDIDGGFESKDGYRLTDDICEDIFNDDDDNTDNFNSGNDDVYANDGENSDDDANINESDYGTDDIDDDTTDGL